MHEQEQAGTPETEAQDNERTQDPGERRHRTVFQRYPRFENERKSLLIWAALALGVMVISILVAENLDAHAGPFRALCIFLAVGFVSVPLALQVGYGIFRNWSAQAGHFAYTSDPLIGDWLHDQFAFIRGDRIMLLAGAGLGLIALLAFQQGDYFVYYPRHARLWLALIMFGSAGFAGMGLYMMFCASRTFWRMGKLEQLSLVVHEHRFGVLSIGSALFRCWLMIGLIWAVYLATAYVGYVGDDPDSIPGLPPMWLLAYPTLPFIIGSFIVCQYPLHVKMLTYKRDQIQQFDVMLAELNPAAVGDLDGERRSQIEFLEAQRAKARALPDWPFNRTSALGMGFTSFTAYLPVVVDRFFPDFARTLIKPQL